MDLLPRRHLKEKKRRENEDEKKHAILDRSFDEAIGVEDREELRAEKRGRNRFLIKALIAADARPRLRIIAAVIGDFPFRIESIRADRAFRRQESAAESRIGPVRFQGGFVLHRQMAQRKFRRSRSHRARWKIPRPARLVDRSRAKRSRQWCSRAVASPVEASVWRHSNPARALRVCHANHSPQS